MQAVLRCDGPDGLTDWPSLLSVRIAGLPLLERHFLTFKSAGINEVLVRTSSAEDGVKSLAERLTPRGMSVSFASEDEGQAKLEVRADTLVDPRLIRELVRLHAAEPAQLICSDV